MNRFAHLNIHLPLVRPETMGRWRACQAKVDERSEVLAERGLLAFLTSDHNDHTGRLWGPDGFKRIGGKGIDYIGVRLPEGWRVTRRKGVPQSVRVLRRKTVDGTIDRHDFHGTQVEITFADGSRLVTWIVQANLGRGEPATVFTENALRIKAAYRVRAVLGFDEIDEYDRPEEHELLAEVFPHVPGSMIAGWGTMSPTVVRGRGVAVKRVKVMEACSGLAGFTPGRPLVEAVIEKE